MFAQSRATVQEGFAGDVIGLTSTGLALASKLLCDSW
jgi:peptide subunit release factor RF-3